MRGITKSVKRMTTKELSDEIGEIIKQSAKLAKRGEKIVFELTRRKNAGQL